MASGSSRSTVCLLNKRLRTNDSNASGENDSPIVGRLLPVPPEKHVEGFWWIGGPRAIRRKRLEHHRRQIEAVEKDQYNHAQIRELQYLHYPLLPLYSSLARHTLKGEAEYSP